MLSEGDRALQPRTPITWVIAASVVALVVVAGVDALRSSDSEIGARTSTASATTDSEASRSREQEIERTGNSWARVFGAGHRCNRYMHQPACEWVGCQFHSGPIQNCTPVSSEVQRSFAGAVVQHIVIKGQRAAARFSNGETVRFEEFRGGGGWWIDRVGAGRNFFE